MTIDSLLSVDLVTADGELRTVSEASDPDLFWALRGGGGNFGIATRFQYRLHPVSMVIGGMLALPLSERVLLDVVDASLEAPEELTQISMIMSLPPMPFVPARVPRRPGAARACRSTPATSRRAGRDGAVPLDRHADRRHGRPDALPGHVPAHRRGRGPGRRGHPVRVPGRPRPSAPPRRSSTTTARPRAPRR